MTKNNGKPLESSDTQRVEELLDMSSLLDSLKGIDLEKLHLEKEKALKPQDRMIRDLRANKKIKRYIVGKTAPRKKLHWKQKKKNLRNYYHEHLRPRRSRRRADLLTTPEGWWVYLTEGWRDNKMEVRMTEQEWVGEVYPLLEGRLPVIFRYDVTGPISLGNIWVIDSDTRSVLFDGKEYILRKLGYIL